MYSARYIGRSVFLELRPYSPSPLIHIAGKNRDTNAGYSLFRIRTSAFGQATLSNGDDIACSNSGFTGEQRLWNARSPSATG